MSTKKHKTSKHKDQKPSEPTSPMKLHETVTSYERGNEDKIVIHPGTKKQIQTKLFQKE